MIGALLEGLLLPPGGPFVAVLVGLWIARRRRRTGVAVAALAAILGWFASTPYAAGVANAWLVGPSLQAATPEVLRALPAAERPQAIVILGGGSRRNLRERPETVTLAPRTLDRVAYGAQLARQTGLPVLVSGGLVGPFEVSEAELMRRVLAQQFGVQARWLEAVSTNTEENARMSAQMLGRDGIGRVLLVTQAYHMRRAAEAFRAAGLAVLEAPHGFNGGFDIEGPTTFVPSREAAYAMQLALHEWVGLGWYRVKRGLSD